MNTALTQNVQISALARVARLESGRANQDLMLDLMLDTYLADALNQSVEPESEHPVIVKAQTTLRTMFNRTHKSKRIKARQSEIEDLRKLALLIDHIAGTVPHTTLVGACVVAEHTFRNAFNVAKQVS